MYTPYDIGDELWVFQRPTVAEMKHQYEEMVQRLTSGDPRPFRSNNIEKIMYLRRKRLQGMCSDIYGVSTDDNDVCVSSDQVPTQDKRPKVLSRFSLSIPLTLELKEPPQVEKQDSLIDLTTNVKKIDSVEEWWGDFHSPNMNIKYVISLGSLSIGDQAIIELSSKLNDLIAKMPGKPLVPSLDMSWNDIYEEGMVAFSAVLEKLGGVVDMRMDGNQMGTVGLEACLNALLKGQPQQKKRSAGSFQRLGNVVGSPSNSPFGSPQWKRAVAPLQPAGLSLALRETNIGDESTTCLASFLKPLPDTKQLNLTALDLTNTYIFDGITAITLALQQNTTLTSLTLNSNMIGDQGAFAIGELFLKNRTLSKLEIRNCDIGPTGTVHLCEGLQAHQGLINEADGAVFTIDVGLNPWEFSGELLLLQTAFAKPKMSINWREGDWTPTDDEEMKSLILAFGETVVMDRIMEGKGLLPLASPAQLIESPLIASYAPIHITTIVDTLSPSHAPPSPALRALSSATATSSARSSPSNTPSVLRRPSLSSSAPSSMASLPTLTPSSATRKPLSSSPSSSPSPSSSSSSSSSHNALALLQTIILLLQTHGKANYKSWMGVLPVILTHLCAWMDPLLISSSLYRRQIEVSTLDLITILSGFHQKIIEDIVVRSGIVALCLENFLAFPNHNVFHLHLVKMIETICKNNICGTLSNHTLSLLSGEFHTRLLNIIKEQSSLSVRSRNGSFSASLLFLRVIEPLLDSKLGCNIKKITKQHEEEQKGCLGGPPPERGKTKIVLNKDAEI